MLWLAIHLPHLCLEVFTRSWMPRAASRLETKAQIRTPSGHAPPQGPCVAVCNRLNIIDANDTAQAHGITSGTKRATAQALAPDILLLDRDPIREQDSQMQMAIWLLQFTPHVSIHGMDGLLLEIGPSLKLFGGKDTIMTAVRSGLMALGYDSALACAPTATGAWLLALSSPGCSIDQLGQLNARLASIPIAVLSEAQAHITVLHGLGIRTIRDLSLLPRIGITRRFGPGLLNELDRALGKLPEPRQMIEAPRQFDLKLELLAQVDDAAALLFGARRMVLTLTGWLAAQHAGVRRFSLLAHHDNSPATCIDIELADASRDTDRLVLLLRERLDKTTLPQAAHSLQLRCLDVVSLQASNTQLFPTPNQTNESLGRLIERLQARLGKGHVQQLVVSNDHRPEAAYKIVPITHVDAFKKRENQLKNQIKNQAKKPSVATLESEINAIGANAIGSHYLARPLWLLDSPIPIPERNHRPYYQSPLQLLAGPERIEGGWWDNDLVQRDYFIAQDSEAILYWIYRSRGTSSDASSSDTSAEKNLCWHVQGIFG